MSLVDAPPGPRETARIRAFQLAYEAQAGIAAAPRQLVALAGHAERAGWDDVTRVCLFAKAVIGRLDGDPSAGGAVAALVERATMAGDQVMLALGLGLRANEAFSGNDPNTAMARDADVARAVVLLERVDRASVELMAAHKVCGVAFSTRSLFELGDAQYRAALTAGAPHTGGSEVVVGQIACNLAETQVCWAAMLRQLGDGDGVAARWRSWLEASRLTASVAIAPGIRTELDALGLLLEAIAGQDSGERARRLRDSALRDGVCNARCQALLALAVALSRSDAGNEDALGAAEQALGFLDSSLQTHLYDLALFLAAGIEARDGARAGLRYARRQLEQRWGTRLSALGAMQSLIQAERIAEEVERLHRHAHLDDLTGIGNRRALGEFLSELNVRDVGSIGLILLDLDNFKDVNDRHGHLTGDAVLVAVARELERQIRPGDLAARLGGDEFVVVLGGVDLETTLSRAAQLLARLGRSSFDQAAPGLRVSLSAGATAGSPADVLELWAEADAALYRAKAGGGRPVRRSRLEGPLAGRGAQAG